MTYHLTEEGPKPCKASVRECPLGGEHFDDRRVAQGAYEARLEQHLGAFRGVVDLPCAFGTMKVMDGDLDNFKARNALISGLCGDLAKAIQDKHGGDGYLVCYGVEDEAALEEAWKNGKLVDSATHAVIGSKASPGEFMDAYGRKSTKDLQDFYGDDAKVIKATPAMLQEYSSGISDKLGNFADSVLQLDRLGVSYDYQEWEDDEPDDFDEEDDS